MIPLQADMDMADPEEHCLWALVNIGSHGDAPLLLPTVVLRRWSRHLYECGFRHRADCQQIRYIPPREGAGVLEAGAGRWVPIDAPDVEADVARRARLGEAVRALSPADREALRGLLDDKGDDDGG